MEKTFYKLLGGKEERTIWQLKEAEEEGGDRKREKKNEIQEITLEEMGKQWKKLKMEKAPGDDGL